MNKTDLADAVAQATDTSKAEAANAVDAVLDTITDALKSGDGKISLIHEVYSSERWV